MEFCILIGSGTAGHRLIGSSQLATFLPGLLSFSCLLICQIFSAKQLSVFDRLWTPLQGFIISILNAILSVYNLHFLQSKVLMVVLLKPLLTSGAQGKSAFNCSLSGKTKCQSFQYHVVNCFHSLVVTFDLDFLTLNMFDCLRLTSPALLRLSLIKLLFLLFPLAVRYVKCMSKLKASIILLQ